MRAMLGRLPRPLRVFTIALTLSVLVVGAGFGFAVMTQDREFNRIVRHWQNKRGQYEDFVLARTGLSGDEAVMDLGDLNIIPHPEDFPTEEMAWSALGLHYERSRTWHLERVPLRGGFRGGIDTLVISVERHHLFTEEEAHAYLVEEDDVDPEWVECLRQVFQEADVELQVHWN